MNLKQVYWMLVSIFSLFLFTNTSVANNIKNSAVVFMYHKFDTSKYPSTNVTLDQFESHLEELSFPKYNIVSINLIVDTLINGGRLPNNTIGISIDDADKSFFYIAWPKFKEKGFPVTLFINTSTIFEDNKNYLNWDQIRQLKKEGVTIASHSHSHNHLPEMSITEFIKELETSNRIFLKEIGEIPTLFAYPYGETDEKFIDVLKNYNYKVAFGQHSGAISEASNFYYLPRFSLNEKYGDISRVKFAANIKGLDVYDFIPSNPHISNNPPFIGFSLDNKNLIDSLDCFVFDNDGQVKSEVYKFNERIEIRLNRKLTKGRSRLNCTAKDQSNYWHWFGHQFYL